MNQTAIEHEALHLPAPARAKLAHKLLESLDSVSDEELEAIWVAEAERRLSEISTGKVEAVSSDKFIADTEAIFR